jgi:hypothetical protein
MTVENGWGSISSLSMDERQDVEVESGLFIERRRILWLPILAAAPLVSPAFTFAESQDSRPGVTKTWDQFTRECLPTAAELHKDGSAPGQDAYLYWIASKAAQLDLATVPEAKVGALEGVEPKVEFGVGFRGVPFFVVEWRMAPNAFLPPHCHPNASVCTVGIDGEAQVRNFEIAGEAPEFSSAREFQVRETRQGLVSNGRIVTLSARRDNIHTFQAGKKGARGIDISTYHGPNVGFSYLDIKRTAADEGNRLFDAHWVKL